MIVGLGNPGQQYVGTRHNAGTMLVELLSQKLTSDYGWRKHYDCLIFKTSNLVLVKTREVFMNESGRLLQGLPEGELYVVHDDLDLHLGEYKIQKGVGPKLHYGVQSIENQLGNKDFWRIRIGIDNRVQGIGDRVQGEEYVLRRFSGEEKKKIAAVLDEIVKTINPGQETG